MARHFQLPSSCTVSNSSCSAESDQAGIHLRSLQRDLVPHAALFVAGCGSTAHQKLKCSRAAHTPAGSSTWQWPGAGAACTTVHNQARPPLSAQVSGHQHQLVPSGHRPVHYWLSRPIGQSLGHKLVSLCAAVVAYGVHTYSRCRALTETIWAMCARPRLGWYA
jgi:hypothetical protein